MRTLLRAALFSSLFCGLSATPMARAATTLELSVTASASLPPDALAARLTAQASAATAATAQAGLNRIVADALHDAQAVKGVTVTTSGYDVSPVYPQRTTWEARQSLNLSIQAAPDKAASRPMLALLGHLQGRGLMLESLNGMLSPKAERQAEQEAISKAVARLKEQAETVAAALGDRPDRITVLRLNVSPPVLPGLRPMLRAQMMAAAPPSISAAPVAEQVTLAGTVRLRRRNP
jgi:predicted secreted protein